MGGCLSHKLSVGCGGRAPVGRGDGNIGLLAGMLALRVGVWEGLATWGRTRALNISIEVTSCNCGDFNAERRKGASGAWLGACGHLQIVRIHPEGRNWAIDSLVLDLEQS